MTPVLEAAFFMVDRRVERLGRVRAEAGEGHEQVIARQDIDRVQLDGAQLIEDVDRVLQCCVAELLGAQRQSARLLGGQACPHQRATITGLPASGR
jgi:hypothetical protein